MWELNTIHKYIYFLFKIHNFQVYFNPIFLHIEPELFSGEGVFGILKFNVIWRSFFITIQFSIGNI